MDTPTTDDPQTEGLLPDPSARVREAFEHIEKTRMQGLPFLNPALHVEAVGFQSWSQFWLGVLVTPWTMNLLLLPREEKRWPMLSRGERQQYSFPAGVYDFIVAEDEMLGDYMVCSLFSPVQQFGDHVTARQTAEYTLQALFNIDIGAEVGASAAADTAKAEGPTLQEKMAAPLSKRDFLRGRFLRKT